MSQPASPAPARRRAPALRHRNYRIYLTAQSVSVIGTWMQNLGQVWLVLTLSGDPVVLGLVVAAQGLPVVILGLFGGVVADRVERRRLIFLTQGLMLGIAVVLAILSLTGIVAVWHVVLLAFALGCVSAVDMPARQAFVVELVGPADVGSAVGLNSTVYSVGRLVGPALAGLTIAVMTEALGDPVAATGVAFALNAVSFAAVLAGLALMRPEELVPSDRVRGARTVRAIARDIGEGLRFVRSTPLILTLLIVPGLIATFSVNFQVLVPVLVQEAGLGAGMLGVLLAAAGLGAFLSALRIGMGGRVDAVVLITGAIVLGVAEILIALATPLPLLVVLLFIGGFGAVVIRTTSNTLIQLATPSALRGRVMSVFTMVFEGASPAGGLVAGALAGALGGRGAFAVVGIVAVALAMAGARALLGRARTSP